MLAFIAAESREFTGLLPHLRDVRKLRCAAAYARTGHLNGRQLLLAANGPGPQLAAQAVLAVRENRSLDTEDLGAVVSYGFCGGLNPALPVGSIFVASHVMGVGDTCCPSISGQPYLTGQLLSQDRVAITPEEKAKLRASGADAVDMEAAGVGSAAAKMGKPFFCIRVITDGAHDRLPLDFNRMRTRQGRFSHARILAAAARRPFHSLPALIALGRLSRQSSALLGDFIADCQF